MNNINWDKHTPQPEQVVNPQELFGDAAKCRLAEIKFEALVRIFDSGVRSVRQPAIMWFMKDHQKPLPPQLFKIEFRLTLETIKFGSPEEIGRIVKHYYNQLEEHIAQYEQRKID